MLRSKGFRCQFISPFTFANVQFVGYAFVDDTDVIVSLAIWTSSSVAAKTLQLAMDTWEGGLKATCGAIVPEKTFWYLIDFSWQSGQWKYKTISECPAKIEIKDIKGVRKELQRYEVHNAQETLGVFLAPDGNLMKQIEKMKNAAIKWADCMRSGRISHDDAWLSFYSTIWKTLLYPLPALNLNKETYNKIMTPILNYLLPAMGICRNFPRTLVYSSTKYMGLGLKHPHTIQEILWIKDILKHTHLLTTTGQLHRISLDFCFLKWVWVMTSLQFQKLL
jgi:hypothetical protein